MEWEIISTGNETIPQVSPENINTIGRSSKIALSSALGGFAEAPRNIAGLAHGLKDVLVPESRGNEQLPSWAPQFAIEKQQQWQQNRPESVDVGRSYGEILQEHLPTSESTRNIIDPYLSKESLSPQSESEKWIEEISHDIGSAMFPVAGQTAKIGRSAAIIGAGNLGKFVSQQVGLEEGGQNAVKVGTMLLTSLGMQPSLKSRASDLYRRVDEFTPQARTISSKPIQNVIRDINKEYINSGNPYLPSKEAFKNYALRGLEEIADGDKVNLKQLIKYKQDLGNTYSTLYKYPDAQAWMSKLSKSVNDSIKNNPEVPKEISKMLIDADNIYKGVASSEKAINFIKNLSGVEKIIGSGTGLATGIYAVSNPEKTKKVLASAAALGVGTKGFSMMRDIITNPSIGNEYIQMMKAASKESAPAVLRHANKLAQSLKYTENEQEGDWEII